MGRLRRPPRSVASCSAMPRRRCVARHGECSPALTTHSRRAPPLPSTPCPRCSPLCTQASPPASGGGGSGGGAVAGAEVLKFYVKRETDAAFAEFEALGSASIAALTEVVIAKLQLGVLPTAVTLTVVGAGAPLRSSLTLAEAINKRDLKPRDELIAKIHAPVASGASSGGDGACFAVLQSLRAADPVHPAIDSLKRTCGCRCHHSLRPLHSATPHPLAARRNSRPCS